MKTSNSCKLQWRRGWREFFGPSTHRYGARESENRSSKEWQTIGPQLLMKRFAESGQVSRKPTQTLGFQLVLFLALGLTLRWLRERTRTRADVDNRLRHAQLVFEHPWAMAVLITAVLTIPLDPLAPRSAGLVAAVFIAVATLRIVQRYLPPANDPVCLGTGGSVHSRSVSRPAGYDAHTRSLRLPGRDDRRTRLVDLDAASKPNRQTPRGAATSSLLPAALRGDERGCRPCDVSNLVPIWLAGATSPCCWGTAS